MTDETKTPTLREAFMAAIRDKPQFVEAPRAGQAAVMIIGARPTVVAQDDAPDQTGEAALTGGDND